MPESNGSRRSLSRWLSTGQPPLPQGDAEALGLAAAACEQGLAALLDSTLVSAGLPWPETARERLRAAHRAALARGVRQLELAARVLDILAQRRLRALPLKGAAVAERLYHSVAERPMADVDLLALDDWAGAVRALEGEGFRLLERADHAWSFRDPVSEGILELHRSVTSCPGLFPIDAEALWGRSQARSGQVPRLPSDADLLVQLSLHAAFQHGLVLSLVQHLDLRRLLERSALDPGEVRASAEACRALPALAAALEVAGRTVGAKVAEALRRALAPHLPLALRELIRSNDPLAFVTPSRPALARVRWELAAGRRFELLRRTLAPSQTPLLPRALAAAVRGARLLRRHGLPLRPEPPGVDV